MKKEEPVLIIENGMEYRLIPSGTPCGFRECQQYEICPKCKRTNAIGEAKLPTGKKILHG